MWAAGIKTKLPTATVTMGEVSVTPTVAVKNQDNLTETTGQSSVYKLESVLKDNRTGKWNGINSLRKAEEIAVDRGVPANTIVLLLLLPLIATLVSGLHYILGLSGYGIFMPTMTGGGIFSHGNFGRIGFICFDLGDIAVERFGAEKI